MACFKLSCKVPTTADLGHINIDRETVAEIGEPDMVLLIDDDLLDPNRGKMMIIKMLDRMKQEIIRSDWPM